MVLFFSSDIQIGKSAGEPEAVNAVLHHYRGYIKYRSVFQGHFNADIQDRLEAQLIKAILQFRFDR
uniref:helix-turn-helix domain-containing protein n=1 Tax=Hungatella hathewayi TaxID=154046 RepID=UPI00356AEFE8